MKRINQIKRKLIQCGICENQINDIFDNGDLTRIMRRMDEFIVPNTVQQVLDSCACRSKDDEQDKQHHNLGGKNENKTLSEIISHINSMLGDYEKINLNADNTLTVEWSFINNKKYCCQCLVTVKEGVKVSELALNSNIDNSVMPLSYCYCCAGSCRRYYHSKYGIELKTKEIVSSPINSKGEKPCSFVFEIVQWR